MPRILNPQDAVNIFTIKTSHYLIAGMSLATALSWNEAIKQGIHNTYAIPKDTVRATIVYSIVMTILLILIIWMLPDTKSELPLDTQHRLHMEEVSKHRSEMEIMQVKMNILLQQIND